MAKKTGKRKKKKSARRAALVVGAFLAGVVVTLLVVRYAGVFKERPRERARVTAPAVPTAPTVPTTPTPAPRAIPPGAARVAIVIDDLGGNIERLRDLLEIDAPITISVLPWLPYSEATAFEAYSSGREVLMHLPMEPHDPANDPGKGALFTTMDPSEIRRLMAEDLKTVPYAVGVNNHMGSRFTEDRAGMREVLDVVRRKGLFFLDSRTTPRSVGRSLASDMGVRTAARNVFLDNERDGGYITGQIAELVEIARKSGRAIAIGHPYPETILALSRTIPALAADGVYVVNVSEVLDGGTETRGLSERERAGR
ncbi:MAG: divergent polysaccharide deacetylase family protein [Thermodesulfobacteriota bacterium]